MYKSNISTIVLFGRTGSGKSSLGNRLALRSIFTVGNSLNSETATTVSEVIQWIKDPSKQIRIIDTPGFADNRTNSSNEQLLADILAVLKDLEGGFNVGIFCTAAVTRVDAHDMQELEMIGVLLGQSVFEHTFIAITQTNTLRPEKRLEAFEKYPTQLPEILSKNGIHWFGPERVLFADFDDFDEKFLVPLGEIIEKTSSYKPQIPEQIDSNDNDSIKLFLKDPCLQGWMNRQFATVAKENEITRALSEYYSLRQKALLKYQEREQTLQDQEFRWIVFSEESQEGENKKLRLKIESDAIESQIEEKQAQFKIRCLQQQQQNQAEMSQLKQGFDNDVLNLRGNQARLRSEIINLTNRMEEKYYEWRDFDRRSFQKLDALNKQIAALERVLEIAEEEIESKQWELISIDFV